MQHKHSDIYTTVSINRLLIGSIFSGVIIMITSDLKLSKPELTGELIKKLLNPNYVVSSFYKTRNRNNKNCNKNRNNEWR